MFKRNIILSLLYFTASWQEYHLTFGFLKCLVLGLKPSCNLRFVACFIFQKHSLSTFVKSDRSSLHHFRSRSSAELFAFMLQKNCTSHIAHWTLDNNNCTAQGLARLQHIFSTNKGNMYDGASQHP